MWKMSLLLSFSTWNPLNTRHYHGTFCRRWPAVAAFLVLEISLIKTTPSKKKTTHTKNKPTKKPYFFLFPFSDHRKMHIHGEVWCLRRFRRLYFKQTGLSVSEPSWYKPISSTLFWGQLGAGSWLMFAWPPKKSPDCLPVRCWLPCGCETSKDTVSVLLPDLVNLLFPPHLSFLGFWLAFLIH